MNNTTNAINLDFTETYCGGDDVITEVYDLAECALRIAEYDLDLIFNPEHYLWSDWSQAYYVCVTLLDGSSYPMPLVFKSHDERDEQDLLHDQKMERYYSIGALPVSDYLKHKARRAKGLNHQELDSIRDMLLNELWDRHLTRVLSNSTCRTVAHMGATL